MYSWWQPKLLLYLLFLVVLVVLLVTSIVATIIDGIPITTVVSLSTFVIINIHIMFRIFPIQQVKGLAHCSSLLCC